MMPWNFRMAVWFLHNLERGQHVTVLQLPATDQLTKTAQPEMEKL
jgi:hypothetical protein